ncbi:MAG TPA: LytTR family DNA-binding domain-containing protein [Mucilaginibacter sp.]|nr:LytTR family DNA-binding domain-containing protein [Mucilaginibacter sp.]
MNLNCIVVDDEPIARKLLQEYIEETDFLILVGIAENPLKAIPLLKEQEIDLVFLDVNMPKMSGMEFLKSSTNLPMIIMTTAYGQYALEGYEMAVVDYLVKPFSLERFIKASQKALELKILRQKKNTTEQTEPGYFYVKCNNKIERIVYDDLLYIEAMANYITLYTVLGKFVVYLTIKGILEKLPKQNFIQVHKSMVVNTDKIKSIEGNMLHIGDTKLTIGAGFHNEAMDKILKNRFIKR